jgi:putative CocE/NonD family hydrolase
MDGKPIKVWLTMRGQIESIPDRIVEADRLPMDGTRWTKMFLADDGVLSPDPPSESVTAEYLYPAGATYVFGEDRYPRKPDEIGGLIFRTEPFAEAQVLLGHTVVRLYAASTQTDTTFLVVLNEVDEAGESRYLQRGYLRAAMRELDPSSTPIAPKYPFNNPQPLKPGQVTEFVIELHPTGSVIEEGHALEVLVAVPSMAPEPIGGWGFVPAAMGINTIHMSPEYPSHVLLPVVEIGGSE